MVRWGGVCFLQQQRFAYVMANTKSAKKAIRVIERRTAINKARRSRMRTFIRKVEEAITEGNQDEASNALRAAQPEVMRVVKHGILHKNTASRKISRLHARVKALGS
jgi:small subunit ribosomal protein S20